jgi:hypothetical protein
MDRPPRFDPQRDPMKSKILGIIAAFALVALSSGTAFAEPTVQTIQIKGEVVDLKCFLKDGDRGADHKSCGVTCAKAGNPIGIVTDAGDVYMIIAGKEHQAGRDDLISRMADTVTVEGTLVKKGGLQAIYVSSFK